MDHTSDRQSIALLVTDVHHNELSKYSTVVRRVRHITYLIIPDSS